MSRAEEKDFAARLGAELDRVLLELVERSHGILPVVEAFSAYNSLRAVDPVTPREFVDACRTLREGAARLVLEELPGGTLILRLRGLSDERYFAEKMVPLLREGGAGVEQESLARRLNVSLSLARVLLDLFLSAGLLCLDNHVEGRVYYPNDILPAGERRA